MHQLAKSPTTNKTLTIRITTDLQRAGVRRALAENLPQRVDVDGEAVVVVAAVVVDVDGLPPRVRSIVCCHQHRNSFKSTAANPSLPYLRPSITKPSTDEACTPETTSNSPYQRNHGEDFSNLRMICIHTRIHIYYIYMGREGVDSFVF